MSIKCSQIVDSFIEFDVKAITKDKSGMIVLWNTDKIKYNNYNGCWWYKSTEHSNNTNWHNHLLGRLFIEEFKDKTPEECIYTSLYPNDPSKWIGTLCGFWKGNNEKDKIFGILDTINESDPLRCYVDSRGYSWEHCKPITKNEVKFAEDEEALKVAT